MEGQDDHVADRFDHGQQAAEGHGTRGPVHDTESHAHVQCRLAELFTGQRGKAQAAGGVAAAYRMPGFFVPWQQGNVDDRLDDGCQATECQGTRQQIGEAEGDRRVRADLAECFDGCEQGRLLSVEFAYP